MELVTILSYAVQALDLVPKVIELGEDINLYISKTSNTVKTAQETQMQIPNDAWDDLKRIREALQEELHKN